MKAATPSAHSVLQAAQILQIGEIAFFDAAANQIYGTLARIAAVCRRTWQQRGRNGRDRSLRNAVVIPVRLGAHVIGSLATGAAQTERQLCGNLWRACWPSTMSARTRSTAPRPRRSRRRNEEFKSSLLDGLAHDLKTPLTAIRTCVTRLITIPPRTEEVRQELLSIIDQESERLQTTITEAIELARIESHELHLEKEPTRLSELVEAALAEVRDENRDALLGRRCAGTRCWTWIADLFRRALLQVLENARKYAPPDSPIRDRGAAFTTSWSTITVLDRGPGISPDELERIFEKFYRGRRGRDKVEGTGWVSRSRRVSSKRMEARSAPRIARAAGACVRRCHSAAPRSLA